VILVYDGECRFCRACLALVLAADRARRVEALTLDEAAARGLAEGVSGERWSGSWHAIDDAGTLRSGGAAVAPLLAELGLRPLAALAERAPGPIERAYRAVADRRGRLSRRLPAGVVRWADRVIGARASAPAPARPSAGGGSARAR